MNLAGGQAASMRIAKDIMHLVEQTNGAPERSKTEEYIQQMQGLMWL